MSLLYRWFPPVVLFGVAAYVWQYNRSHPDQALLFPLLDGFPALQGDIGLQAQVSWVLCAIFGAIALAQALWDQVGAGRASEDENER